MPSTTLVNDLLTEAEQHLTSSQFIYLYSKLRLLSGSGYAPFSFDTIDCLEGTRDQKGIPTDRIFLSLLKTLRKEDKGDANGLMAELGLNLQVFDVKKLDEAIERCLVDRGDPVELCQLEGTPLKAVHATHQHVGSQCNCLCAKFGMHNTQIMVDHVLRSEDEKRAKEVAESKLRPPRSHALVEGYQQLFGKHVLDPATPEEEDEDAQIDALDDGILLQTLKDQLKPDSFLATALTNQEAVVHMNDRWPTKECVYTVSCDEIAKVVKVTFRGTVSLENWQANLAATRVMHPNPIKEHYEGREENLGLHEGFSNYLLRKRKDTGVSKLDEILQQVNTKGSQLFGDKNYRLVVAGHSLGGSLATIFGFYASAHTELQANPSLPVDIFSFCAPKSGGIAFALAFQRLEETKRLRHFRFFHTNDIVPRTPTHHLWDGFGDVYTHVGIGIEIPKNKVKDGEERFHCIHGDELYRHRYWVSHPLIELFWRLVRTLEILLDLIRFRMSEHSLDVMRTRIHRIREELDADMDAALDLDSMCKYVYNDSRGLDFGSK